jgi:hypothetical protein
MTKSGFIKDYTLRDWVTEEGLKLSIMPLGSNGKGSYTMVYPNGIQSGGEYKIIEESGHLFFDTGLISFRISFSNEGFKLFSGNAEAYSFKAAIKS